jgi:hypothetical protein
MRLLRLAASLLLILAVFLLIRIRLSPSDLDNWPGPDLNKLQRVNFVAPH